MPLSADLIDRIGDEVAARTVSHGGKHGMPHQRSTGTLLFRRPTGLEPAARRGGLELHPFKVGNASTPAPAAKVTVRFGQVNSTTPTIGGTALGTTPAPTLTVITGVVYLHVTVDAEDGTVTAAVIENAATLPAASATEGYLTLAEVTVVSDAVTVINQAVTHSLQHRRCGVNDHHFWGL